MRVPFSLMLALYAGGFAFLAYVADFDDDRFNHTLMAVAIVYILAALVARFAERKEEKRG